MNNAEITKINDVALGLAEEKSIILANMIGKLFGGNDKSES